MYIGISGKPGTGKDTLAQELFKYGWVRESLGDRIREITTLVTGLSMDDLRSHPQKDEPLPEFNGKTGRELTIEVGAGIEERIGFDIWCKMTDRVLQERNLSKAIFPDIRTPIQANWIKSKDGLLVRIEDGSGPHKYEIENKLDDYNNWDLIISKEEWFSNKEKCLRKLADIILRKARGGPHDKDLVNLNYHYGSVF